MGPLYFNGGKQMGNWGNFTPQDFMGDEARSEKKRVMKLGCLAPDFFL